MYRATAREFEALREAITTHVARVTPRIAPELLWSWFTLAGAIANSITEQCWKVHCICEQACIDVVGLSAEAGIEPAVLVVQMTGAIASERSGENRIFSLALTAFMSSAPAYRGSIQDRPKAMPAPNGARHERLQSLQRALARFPGWDGGPPCHSARKVPWLLG
ncbi:DUF6880 family protein [Burkholderia territorii]|uniref:DUF6880 family protein n=1 Tax=Burkholderia territorii TaxID=1503055 RepID=UPI0039BFD1CF